MGCGPSSTQGDTELKKSEVVNMDVNDSHLNSYSLSPETLQSGSISFKAAILIQNWYRRYRARLEARRRYTWMIYQSIEYSGEQDQLKLYNFFNDILLLANKGSDFETTRLADALLPTNDERMKSTENEDAELFDSTDYTSIDVEATYKGPKLEFPLKSNVLGYLVEKFRNGEILHARYLLQLLHETRKVLKSKPNINQASTSISKQMTICGDLHGKLDDLSVIFYKNNFPDVTNPYIFNGDFVDRGPNSVETIVILFVCFLLNPTDVFLNRGNHEDHVMNYRYGFIKEVQTKYKIYATKLVRLFGDVFSWLPLATIVDQSVLVCHGGISDKTDLKAVSALDRHKYMSALRPPLSGDIDYEEWRQVLDLLWSDPKTQNGCKPNTFRGGGSYFGPDVTHDILDRHGLSLLIRSHECKIDGYEYTHDQKVITVFSASNYYEEGSNRGAYLKLDKALKVHAVQYMCSKNHSTKTTQQRVSLIEDSALRDLRAKVSASRVELIEKFKQLDVNGKGTIKISDWCDCLNDVMGLRLPWRTMRGQLAKLSSDGEVDYMSTFSGVTITNKFSEGGISVTEQLYKNRESLETIFRMIDKDNSGQISLSEFKEACSFLSKHTSQPLSEQAVEDMARSIDINKDGFIDFNEFLEAFRIVDSEQQTNLERQAS